MKACASFPPFPVPYHLPSPLVLVSRFFFSDSMTDVRVKAASPGTSAEARVRPVSVALVPPENDGPCWRHRSRCDNWGKCLAGGGCGTSLEGMDGNRACVGVEGAEEGPARCETGKMLDSLLSHENDGVGARGGSVCCRPSQEGARRVFPADLVFLFLFSR